jgi:hypothetical protein
LPVDEDTTGKCTLSRILAMFMTTEVVAMDEAIEVFRALVGRNDGAGRSFVKATKPILAAARKYLPALEEMRSRWVAHGFSKSRGVRESPIKSRFREGAPRDEEELAFVIGVYLQYAMLVGMYFDGLRDETHAYVWREVLDAPPLPVGPSRDEHEERLRDLTVRACAELGLEEPPLLAYSDLSEFDP